MRAWYFLVSILVIVLIGGSVVYNRVEQHRETCAVVNGLVTSYLDSPPTSNVGRQRQADWINLQDKLGC